MHRVTLSYVAKETLTVRVEAGTRESLDAIAESLNRDRSFVVNEALASYVEVFQWQVDHIKRAIKEADSGKFATGDEVKRKLARLKK